jgi:high-affinity Fe2+/Pb2+ permease
MNYLKTYFFLGILSGFVLFLGGFFTGLEAFTFITGGIGLISLLIAGVFSGVFISGDKIRANTSIENSQERKKRTKNMYAFALFGVPNFIAAIILTVFF